ncbi:MAG TPA: autotransporter domain-containing protein [Pedomonas sp.]|uniref:autotransporter domain-containing protein n=1 Tax=Pedomonas sp. TaxID=2976421 RepID=UPI002F4273DE
MRQPRPIPSRGGFKLETPQAGSFQLRAKIGWQHGFGDRAADKALRLGSAALFVVECAPLSRNAGVFDGEAVWRLSPATTIGAGYSGMIVNAGETHAAKATLTVGF